MLNLITPVILTYNEADNLERTLEKLIWATQIVVVDSFSTDATLAILKRYPQVEVFQRTFDTHAEQWNYGLQQVKTEWVLSLDADYCLSDPLLMEIATLTPSSEINSYFIPFRYCVFGQPLRATLLPPREALFRKAKATYINDGHTQLLQSEGQSIYLKAFIDHDDRKPLNRWLWAQGRYAVLEAEKLRNTPSSELSWGDRLRRHQFLAPWIVLIYCLILHRGILDGKAGLYYALQRFLAEILLSLHLLEHEQKAILPQFHPGVVKTAQSEF